MKLLILVLACVCSFASADYVQKDGLIYYHPNGMPQMTLDEARTYCAKIGGDVISYMNPPIKDTVGLLFQNAKNTSFWVEAVKMNTGYFWKGSGNVVDVNVWLDSEPRGTGNVVLKKSTTGNIGLYIHTNLQDTHMTVCTLVARSKENFERLQAKWQTLPSAELEPLENMIIEVRAKDPTLSLKPQVDELKETTNVLLRLIQKLILA